MLAVYDLAQNSPTYDALTPALCFEAERKFRGDHRIDIVVTPGPKDGFRNDVLWPRDHAERVRVRDNVAWPIFRMLPSVASFKSADAGAFPGAFGAGRQFLYLFEALATGLRPLRPRKEMPLDPRLITMTLRECDHWPQRNSNVQAWMAAALHLSAAGWRVVIVRDTYARQLMQSDAVEIMPAPDLETRGALYRSAFCNLFVNNGPAWFAMACDAPAVVVKPATEGAGRTHGKAWFKRFGIDADDYQPAGWPRHQRLCWRPDDAAGIVWAFLEFESATRSRQHASLVHG